MNYATPLWECQIALGILRQIRRYGFFLKVEFGIVYGKQLEMKYLCEEQMQM
jgi:hypothetical protein